MAQVDSCWALTTEALVCIRVSPCGICSGHSGIGTGFSLSSLVLPVSNIPLWFFIPIYQPGDEQ
jgi:hypothetical protein